MLLVDDDSAYLEVLKFFLERDSAITAETITSAREALNKLSGDQYDAIVSDYLMPEMDGLEFLKIVRLQGNDIPFVMLTGRGREDVAIQALNSGADFYVQKGGDPKTQYAELANMIKRSAMQKRAENAVKDGERFLKGVFESIQDGISVLGTDMVIERVNPTMEKWYAHSMPLVGKKCYEAYHGRSEPCGVCPTRETISSARPERKILPKLDEKGGSTGWLDVWSFPMVDHDTGEVTKVIEYLRDVTIEENTRRALEESEKQYRNLVELANEGILAIDERGTTTFVNPRGADMLGYSHEEIVGKPITAFLGKDWADIALGQLVHRRPEEKERLDLEFTRKDGTELQTVVSVSPLTDAKGVHSGVLAIITDMSETRRVLESLALSEEKFSSVFQKSPHMMIVCRADDGQIIEVNQKFVEKSGRQREETVGKTPVDAGILSEEEFAKVSAFHESLTGPTKEIEVRFKTASGETRVARMMTDRISLAGVDCILCVSRDVTAEGRDTTELRRERDVLKSVIESSPDCIVIANTDGDIVECNQAASTLLGLQSKSELIGRNAMDVLDYEDHNKIMRIGEKLLREGAIRSITIAIKRKDGIIINGELSASIVNDPLGKPLYVVGIIRDITDRIRHESVLERSLEDRKQIEAIINRSPAVLFLWKNEPGWPVEFVSSNVTQFGFEPSDFLSQSTDYASVIHPDDRDRVREEVSRYTDAGLNGFNQEYRIVSPSGNVHWVDDRTIVLKGRDGGVEGYHGVVIDITEIKTAREQLSRTERELKLFMDLSPTMTFLKDRDGRYVYVNNKFEEVLGLSASDILGKTAHNLFQSDVADRIVESDRAVFDTRTLGVSLLRIPQAEGYHEHLTYRFLVPSISDETELLAGVGVDVTEQRRSERALRQANDKLDLLGRMTRHDTMNQLSILLSWLEVARVEESRQSLDKMFGDIERAALVIKDLLEFTSDYQEVGVHAPVWVSLEDAVEAGLMGLSRPGVNISVQLRELEIFADPMIEKVFRNLVDNSLRHGGDLTEIRIGHRYDGRKLVITIEDDGVGVANDEKPRIFERGFGKHTGLGLYMVKEVLEITGLGISETGVKGHGARFEIVVPEGNYRASSKKS